MKKLFKLTSILLALGVVAVSCDVLSATQEVTSPSSVTTDAAEYTIPAEGGSVAIAVTAAYDWSATIEAASSIDDISGMTITPEYGLASAKPSTITVTATANEGYDRAATVSVLGTGASCAVKVNQAGAEGPRVDKKTVTEFLAAAVDASVYYEVTGKISAITNDYYNDFNLSDGVNEVLVYGLYDGRGGASLEHNYLSTNGITAGYTITIQAYRGEYNGTPEALKAYIVGEPEAPKDPMIIIESPDLTVAAATTTASFAIQVKNLEANWTVTPDGSYDWVKSYTAEGTEDGTIDFVLEENLSKEAERTASFTVASKGAESVVITLTQEAVPDIYDVNLAEFNAAEVSTDKWYRLTGVVTKITNSNYGNLYIADANDTVYVYGVLPEKGSSVKNKFSELGIKEHDILTVIGNRGEYKGTSQAANAYLEKNITTTPAAIADVLAQESTTEVWYEVTGTVTSIVNDAYGNLYLQDETGEAYAYGCYKGWGATSAQKKLFGELDVIVGDKLTMIANKGDYKGSAQLTNGIFISREHASGPTPGPDPTEKSFGVSATEISATYKETSASFGVTGNVAWTVTCPEGVTADPASGEGEATVKLTFPANEGDEDVTYAVKVETADTDIEEKSYTVTVKHACYRLPATVAELIAAIPSTATSSTTAERFSVKLNEVVVSGIYQDKNIFFEDETGGIQLIEEGSAYFPGAIISGKASVKAYKDSYGRAVITSLDQTKITGYKDAPCTVVTVEELNSNIAKYVGKRVKIEGVKVTTTCQSSKTTSQRQGVIEQEGASIMLYTYLYPEEAKIYVAAESEGDVTGYPVNFKGTTPELSFWDNDDFYYTKAPSTIFEGLPESKEMHVGDEYTCEITTNSPATIQFSSSDPGVASIDSDGKITALESGTTTITASIAASGTFEAKELTCELTVSAAVNPNHADFETLTAKSSYASATTTNGWNIVNCAVQVGAESGNNPKFPFLGKSDITGDWAYAVCMNGKTSAVGTITSPTLTTGCGTLSFNYAYLFSESNGIKFKVEIVQNNAAVKTFTVEKAKTDCAMQTKYTFSEEVNVSGDFQIVFTNLSPSNNNGNKDRYSVWDVQWTAYSN